MSRPAADAAKPGRRSLDSGRPAPIMEAMLIATDIDGVLADFAGGWVERYNRDFGAAVDPDALTEWGAIVTATRFDTWDAFFGWLADVDGFWLGLRPVTGSIAAVGRLRRAGHDVIAVTQRPDTARDQTVTWLDRHYGGMPLHLMTDKSRAGADVLIDDSPVVLDGLTGSATLPIRFRRPWNDGAPGLAVAAWDEVVRLVDGLAVPVPGA